MDPGQNGSEVDFGRRGNTPCKRIDELFKPNWVPRTPKQTPQTPQEASQEVLEKLVFFSKKKWADARDCNLLAVSRSRFAGAGDGSQCLIVS